MNKLLILLLSVILFSCTDCSTEDVKKLKVGMSTKKLVELLGEPRKVEYRSYGNLYKYIYGSRQWLYVTLTEDNKKVKSWY